MAGNWQLTPRCEFQLTVDSIELLQMALHNDFDKRYRTTRIPEDNYTQAIAAYKCVAAQDRALKLLCSL
ncbi:hypothetical protein E4U11_004220 [Claviceps purpurea]|nr:hypothetical protein E4U11_004220 [Claviceps purpurea]